MRRTMTAALLGAGISFVFLAEGLSASSAPNVTGPTNVKKGENFIITVRNCQSGTSSVGQYSAVIKQEATAPDGFKAYGTFAVDESDGVTEHQTQRNIPGTWKELWWCEHTWNGGSGRPWPAEELTIEVSNEEAPKPTPTITDAERKKCDKKKTKKARRRCLKAARAD